ncbi:hemagglutinin repeat-containing protein [Achromobacter xylosoxidans]
MTGVNAYDAIQADPRAAGGLNISIDLGSSKSQSTTKRESASVRGSSVAAGGDLTVIAQGGGQASNVTVTGSSLSAGNNAAIKADGDIALRAAQNTFEQHSTNKSTNASIGVGVTVGSQGVGFTLNVAASAAQVAARIELENNSRYMNRDKVGRLKAELTDDLLRTCGTNASCFQEGFDRADRVASAYDVALILSHYPQLTKERADTLAQAVLDLAPGVSNASALYELVTGRTATGEEANRFFSSLGLVPVVGGMLKKGGQALHVFADAGKAVDVGKIGGSIGGKAALGFSEDAARAALSNIGRIDHSARHLIEAGIITANSGSKAARQAFQEIGQVILTNPEKTFDHVMSQGGQAVKGFYRKINGADVIIFVAKENVGKIATGDIVTAIKPSVQQMRNFGL